MYEGYNECRFDLYCETCKHENVDENEEPCFKCLDNAMNLYSSKPVEYEEKE